MTSTFFPSIFCFSESHKDHCLWGGSKAGGPAVKSTNGLNQIVPSCTVTASISTPLLSCLMGSQAASLKRNNADIVS